jgi:hypothetical protein
MTPFDTLRERLEALPGLSGNPLVIAKDDALAIIDAVAEEHPGVVDNTVWCEHCGRTMVTDWDDDPRSYITTEDADGFLVDGWLVCDDCYKQAQP